MRILSVSMVVALFGCQKEGVIELDTGVITTEDSGDTSNVETGTVDTGSTETDNDPIASFIVGEVTANSTFSLTWVDPMGETLVFGDTAFSSSAEAGLLEVYLPTPPDEEMIVLEPTVGWSVAFYLPSIHEDSNGDGGVDILEAIYGVGEYWLFFSNLSIPDLDVDYGWNALKFGQDLFLAPYDLPVNENLHPKETIEISGVVSGDQSILSDGRLVALPLTLFMGHPVTELLVDEKLVRNWTISIENAPPIDHNQENPDLDSSYAIEYLAVYNDLNSSSSFDENDEIVTGICRDGRSVSLVYMGAPRDLLGNVYYAFQGLTPGWFVMESWIEADGTEKNEFVSSPESVTYEIGEPCWVE